MRVLLDTHIIIWALTEPQKLSTDARTLIESRENVLLASAASAWEIGTKYRLGKLAVLEATVLNYRSQLARLGAEDLNVTTSHALLAGQLAWSHGDPSTGCSSRRQHSRTYHSCPATPRSRRSTGSN